MERRTKIILLISGGVILAGSIGLFIYLSVRKKQTEEQDGDLNPYVSKSGNASTPGSTTNSGASNTGSAGPTPSAPEPMTINPKYNTENELSNPLSQLKNRMLYPKRKSAGGWDYANVRKSAEVNNNTSWWTDGIDNLLTTINSGTPIGKVISQTFELYNGYSYRWFKVELYKPVRGWLSDYTEGFVRADTVTFKPY